MDFILSRKINDSQSLKYKMIIDIFEKSRTILNEKSNKKNL